MNKKILNFLGVFIVLISLVFVTSSVDAAKRFDVTDISYSYVSYNHPYYPNVPYYNNYNYYDNYTTGYVSPYTGYVTYPVYSNYVTSYYPTYTYQNYYPNYVSYVSPQANVTFSWQ